MLLVVENFQISFEQIWTYLTPFSSTEKPLQQLEQVWNFLSLNLPSPEVNYPPLTPP